MLKHVPIGLIFSFTFSVGLLAGIPDSTLNNIYQNTPRGLQFGISSYLSLGHFDGKTISYVKWINPAQAIRWGLDFSVSGNTNHRKSTYSYYDAANDTTIIGSQSSNAGAPNEVDLNFRLRRMTINYGNPRNGFAPYWGIGPFVSGGYDRQISDSYNEGATSRKTATTMSGGLGGAVLLGAEWFVTRSLSLHVEYVSEFGAAYETNKNQLKSIYATNDYTLSTVTNTNRSWAISSKTLFGLTVRFK